MDDKLAFIMWEAIVILMVVIALTISVKGIANNTTYWKKYHSADLALMTDLILINQGDFEVNYDMKELKKNVVTKMLNIDNLVFQTVLTKDAYFLYDESKDKDRFPQSYIFAKTDSRLTINPFETTSSYIVLNKKGDSFSINTNINSQDMPCPALVTASDLSTQEINAIPTSSSIKDYSDYIDAVLTTTGTGTNPELLIILSESSGNKNRIYSDISQTSRSNKLSCLIKRQLITTNPSLDLQELLYDYSLDNYINNDPIKTEKNKYIYWIIIELNKSAIDKESLANGINAAIGEYYGPQK
ncbi:MAG: hypothetical protein ACP5N1_06720 [Candidatus Woesearchaeota archaeon]